MKQAGDRLSTGGDRQDTRGLAQWGEESEPSVVSCKLPFGSSESTTSLLSSSPLSSSSEVCAGFRMFKPDALVHEANASTESRGSDCSVAGTGTVSLKESWLFSSQATCADSVSFRL